ncbi:hypothetical protein AYO46_00730 [Betaproteobacteria bacterium SCGC AG-212-J23]|nr:hypothetical protein AYO46_00730 [Betaproteobacteria bacterium SCGC AG-212-J23]
MPDLLNLLAHLATPLLGVLVGLMTVAVTVAFRSDTRQKEIQRNVVGLRPADLHGSIDNIHTGVKDIGQQLNNTFAPQLQAIYQTVAAPDGRIPLTVEAVQGAIKKIGFERSAIVAQGVFITGGVLPPPNSLTVSLLFLIPGDAPELIVRAFSYAVTDATPSLMADLLDLGAKLRVGKIGLASFKGKKVIMVDHSILAPNKRLDEEQLHQTVHRLISGNIIVLEHLRKLAVPYSQVLGEEFLRLSNEQLLSEAQAETTPPTPGT